VHAVDTLAQRRSAIQALIGQLKYLPMAERLQQVSRLAASVPYALPQQLMMSSEQVRQLHRAGMGIGAHTANHPILAALPPEAAQAEIAAGRQALERIIGAPVPLFAYPNGKPGSDYRAEHVAMVKAMGFEGAVSTAWGASRGPHDVFQLPRFTPWDRSPLRYLLRLARNLTLPAERV
jgi:peptidoglycan/xylan/chitin deacetylase (PgdA/CDA1 family)